MKTEAKQREEWRLKRQAKLAAMTPEQRKELFAKNSARRSAIRAAKALEEGRIPGKPGKKAVSVEERKLLDKAAQKRFREKNIDRIRERDAAIKRKERSTPEGAQKHRDKQKAYASKNKEKMSEKHKIWAEENKGRRSEYNKKRFQEKREEYYVYGREYRARKLNAPGTHTSADIRALYFEQKGCCALCELPFLDEKTFHVDHWKPLSKGGSNDKSNLKLLHPKCNLSKGAKLPEEFNKRSA